MALPMNIVKFANGDANVLKTYDQMRDYYFHYMSTVEGKQGYGDYDSSVSLDEKEVKMHNALLSEVERVSNHRMPNGKQFEFRQKKWCRISRKRG